MAKTETSNKTGSKERDTLQMLFEGQRLFFVSGQTKDLAFRRENLQKLYGGIVRYQEKIGEALQKDLGKCAMEAYATEIGITLKSISHAAKNLQYWAADQTAATPLYMQPGSSKIVQEPYGSVLIMSPFNYPFQLAVEPLIGAMAAGNTCIIKPSELAPATSALLKEMIGEIFDPLYIAVAEGGIETNQKLLRLPFDYIFFTGSRRVGKIVMQAAAENLTPVTLELGGKSPVIVDETANLEITAKRIIWGKTLNMGQTCVAPDYILADERIAEDLTAALQSAIVEFYGENPQQSPDLGRIVNQKHFDRLAAILAKDKDYIICGGKTDRENIFIEPTLLRIPDLTAAAMQEEIFGPILPILTFADYNAAKAIIAQNPKPLALYIFSQNKNFQEYFCDEIAAGGVCINDTIMHLTNPNLPFGGIGGSGMGAYHGKASFDTFSHSKSVFRKSVKTNLSFLYPPYKNSSLSLIKKILK